MSQSERNGAAQVMLSRWAQQDDVVVGLATNGRRRPELQAMVGDLVNMIALRTQMQSEQTFLQVLLDPLKHAWHLNLNQADQSFLKSL